MKKLITLILIFALLPVYSVGANNYNSDSGYLGVSHKILSDLNIISEVDDYSAKVTRAEFTMMLVKAMNIGIVADSAKVPFEDISESDSFYPYVETAYKLGIISSDNMFYPTRYVTYNEVIKMTVCAAGYEFLAKSFGGYPGGYIAAANKLGMLKGINSSECNIGTCLILLYNTLTTSLPEMTITNGNVEYGIDSGVCILESAYGYSIIEGRIDGAQFFGGKSGKGVGKGKTAIDDVILKSGFFDTDSLYGRDVVACYDSEGVLKAIYAVEFSTSDIIVLNGTNDYTYDNLTYTYFNDNYDKKKVNLEYDSLIVLNGKYASYSKDIMTPVHGTVKLLKTSGKGFDTVIIDSYTELTVGGINKEKKFVTDESNPQNSVTFDEENYESVSIYDQNGRKIKFQDIQQYDVVWFARSVDGKILKAIVSKNNFAGEYFGMNPGESVTIDGNKYPVTKGRENIADSSLMFGTVVMVYLNPDGEVVYVKAASIASDLKVAYLVASKAKNSLESSVIVKLFTQDGYMKTYELAPKFTLNGKSFKIDEYDALPKNEYAPSSMKVGIVSYSLNRDNKISSINYDEAVARENGCSFTELYENSKITKVFGEENDKYIRYYATPREIVSKGKSIFVKPETVQFRVPCEKDILKADDENFTVRKFSEISSGEYMNGYDHTAYTTTDGLLRSDYVLSTYELSENIGSVSTSGPLYIIKDMSIGFDNEEQECTILTLESKTDTDLKVFVKDTKFINQNNIGIGDLIKAEYDLNKNVIGMTLIYKCGDTILSNISDLGDSGYTSESATVLTSNAGMAARASSYIVLGKIYARDDDIISILPYEYDINGEVDDANLKNYSLISITKILKFDTKTQTVSTVDYSNINDYINMGSLSDTVIYENGAESLYVFE